MCNYPVCFNRNQHTERKLHGHYDTSWYTGKQSSCSIKQHWERQLLSFAINFPFLMLPLLPAWWVPKPSGETLIWQAPLCDADEAAVSAHVCVHSPFCKKQFYSRVTNTNSILRTRKLQQQYQKNSHTHRLAALLQFSIPPENCSLHATKC